MRIRKTARRRRRETVRTLRRPRRRHHRTRPTIRRSRTKPIHRRHHHTHLMTDLPTRQHISRTRRSADTRTTRPRTTAILPLIRIRRQTPRPRPRRRRQRITLHRRPTHARGGRVVRRQDRDARRIWHRDGRIGQRGAARIGRQHAARASTARARGRRPSAARAPNHIARDRTVLGRAAAVPRRGERTQSVRGPTIRAARAASALMHDERPASAEHRQPVFAAPS